MRYDSSTMSTMSAITVVARRAAACEDVLGAAARAIGERGDTVTAERMQVMSDALWVSVQYAEAVAMGRPGLICGRCTSWIRRSEDATAARDHGDREVVHLMMAMCHSPRLAITQPRATAAARSVA